MELGNMLLSSMNITVDNKKQYFDRTIQAIVKDNSDPNKIGEIKIKYKDAILPVYTDVKETKNYPKGSHIYVTVPNNDMSARKTVLGLVEKIGPLIVMDSIDGYSLDSQYNDNAMSFEDTDFSLPTVKIGWAYQKDDHTNNWILKKIENDEELNIQSFTEREKIINFFEVLKTFSLSSNAIKIIANFTTLLLDEQSNYFNSDYGIGIDFYFKEIPEEDIVFDNLEEAQEKLSPIKVRFNIDQLTGNPFFQAEESQSIIIDTSKISLEQRLQKIKFYYYRKNIPAPSNINLPFNPQIKISNFVLEAVTQVQKQETAGLALYITTPKGRTFLSKKISEKISEGCSSDEIILNAALKEDGTQIDNTSLSCWWYEKDFSYLNFNKSILSDSVNISENGQSIYDMAGPGWRLVSIDENGEPINTNAYSVNREDLLGLSEKEYRAVGIYKGAKLDSSIVIKNLDEETAYSLRVLTNRIGNDDWYTYDLEKSLNSSALESNIKWYYISDSGITYPLRSLREIDPSIAKRKDIQTSVNNPWQVKLKIGAFSYSGQILCEVYQYIKGIERLAATLTQPYDSQNINDIKFYNFEQVFLYDINGKINLIGEDEENNYSVAYRPVGISGNEISNIIWRIPKDFFERPSNIYAEDTDEHGFYQIINTLSLSDLRIKTTYPTFKNETLSPQNLNIVVDFTYNEKKYRKTTNFSFIREGMDGTNGSGIYCRIVPNVDLGILETGNVPNTIFMATQKQSNNLLKILFNFLPLNREMLNINTTWLPHDNTNSNIHSFKAQLWKNNQKIYDDYKIEQNGKNISNIKWSLIPEDEKYIKLSAGTHIAASEIVLSDDDEYEKWLKKPHGIKTQISYQGRLFEYILPFLIVSYPSIDTAFSFGNIKRYNFLNEYDSMPLTYFSKFYYNENGEIDDRLAYLPNNSELNEYAHNSIPLYILFKTSGELKYTKRELDFLISGPFDLKNNYVIGDFNLSKAMQGSAFAKGIQGNYFYSVPLLQKLFLLMNNLITEWSGDSAAINEEEGTVLAKQITAGKKEIDNTFTGAVVGMHQDQTGLFLFSKGQKSLSLDSNGIIQIGLDPVEKIYQKGLDKTISNGTQDGLTIDLSKGSLKYKYLGDIDFIQDEEDNAQKSIEIQKDNGEYSFLLTENGTLQAITLVGENDKNRQWGIYTEQKAMTMPIKYKYFIKNDGDAGFNNVYIGTTKGNSETFLIDGLVLKPNSLLHNLSSFAASKSVAQGQMDSINKRKGFALSEDGLCVVDENNYVGAREGMVVSNQGFFVGDSMDANGWRITSKGITNKNLNATVTINEEGITIPKVNTNKVDIIEWLLLRKTARIRVEVGNSTYATAGTEEPYIISYTGSQGDACELVFRKGLLMSWQEKGDQTGSVNNQIANLQQQINDLQQQINDL